MSMPSPCTRIKVQVFDLIFKVIADLWAFFPIGQRQTLHTAEAKEFWNLAYKAVLILG